MRLLACPDKFRGTLTASAAAGAMAVGGARAGRGALRALHGTAPLSGIKMEVVCDVETRFVDAACVADALSDWLSTKQPSRPQQ